MWRSLHNHMPQWRGKIKPHVRGITQSTSALAFNLVGIIAGSILANSYGVINEYAWALMIFPGMLSIRGAIGGLFSGRLSTGLHIGTIKPTIANNTKDAYLLISAIVTLTWISASLIGTGSALISAIRFGSPISELLRIYLVTLSALGLSILVISPTTLLVSIHAFNRGLDPDMVVYPITSSTADVAISFIFVMVLRVLSSGSTGQLWALILIALIFSSIALGLFVKLRKEPEYIKTLREFMGTLIVVTIIVNITGYTLGRISDRIGNMAEIYATYPAMIDTVGDVGSIVGSTETTKLSLGVFKAEFASIKDHMSEITYAWSGSLILFTAYALISSAAYGFQNIKSLLAVVWCTNLLVIPLIVLISFVVGIVTFKRGLDPDNFVIPFETSLADSLTTIGLFLMILLWYK